MVNWKAVAVLAEQVPPDNQPLLLRLNPHERLRAIMALILIIALGLFLVVFIRSLRRMIGVYVRGEPFDGRRGSLDRGDDWARLPLDSSNSPRQDDWDEDREDRLGRPGS